MDPRDALSLGAPRALRGFGERPMKLIKNVALAALIVLVGYVLVGYVFGLPHIFSMKDTDRDIRAAEMHTGSPIGTAVATNREPQALYAYGIGRVMTEQGWILIDREAASVIKEGTVIRVVQRQGVDGLRKWGAPEGMPMEWCRWTDLHQHEPWVCSGLEAGKTWTRGDAH